MQAGFDYRGRQFRNMNFESVIAKFASRFLSSDHIHRDSRTSESLRAISE
jgi:hypothetical protein